MNETRNIPIEISITKNSNYEGKFVLDYLISSMQDAKNEINEIHHNISYKNNNIQNDEKIKDKNKAINEEFNKIFKKDENNLNLFEYINNINKNHIKKYKTILNFLNLNLIFEKNNENKENKESQNQEVNKKKSNLLKCSSIKYQEVNIGEEIEDRNKEKEFQNKNDISNITEKSFNQDLASNNNKYNTIFEYEINDKKEKNEIEKDKITENISNSIINYKDTVNYIDMNTNKHVNIKKNKFILEHEAITYENDVDNEDNEIIINENDDSICHLDETQHNINNQNNKIKNDTINNESKKSDYIEENKEDVNNEKILDNEINISNQEKIDLVDNKERNNINIDNNIENNLEKENIKESKDRINIKNVEKRLFRKNNANSNINLTYIDNTDKKDLCTCFVF